MPTLTTFAWAEIGSSLSSKRSTACTDGETIRMRCGGGDSSFGGFSSISLSVYCDFQYYWFLLLKSPWFSSKTLR